MTIRSFEELEVWKLARELTREIYAVTKQEPFSRDYGLKDQIRRAAVSIMSNIAEGFEREGNQELIQFLSIAKGSCGEVRCQLYVARDQEYITVNQFNTLSEKAKKLSIMIKKFISYLKGSSHRGAKFKKPARPTHREEVLAFLEKYRREHGESPPEQG